MQVILSIDAGHTAEHTVNDLLIADKLLKNGGLIFLDDYYNPHWPGVHEGFSRYMIFNRARIALLLCIGNKLLLTTISYHEIFYNEFIENLLGKPHIRNLTKYVTMHGYDVIAINLR